MDQKAGGEDTSSLDNTSGSPNKRQGKEKEISSVNPKIFNHKSATRKRTHLYPPTSPHLRQIQSVPLMMITAVNRAPTHSLTTSAALFRYQ